MHLGAIALSTAQLMSQNLVLVAVAWCVMLLVPSPALQSCLA